MCCTDAVGTSVTTAYHQYVLTLSRDTVFFAKLHTCQHTVLLCQQLKGQMNTFQFSSWYFKVASGRSACSNDDGVSIYSFCVYSLAILKHYTLLLEKFYATVDDSLVEFEVWYAVA